MKSWMTAGALAVCGCLAGCAAPPSDTAAAAARAPRQCFPVSLVNAYREVGEGAVLLRVGASEIWRLVLVGSCPDIEWSRGRIRLQQHFGGGRICSGLAADVITSDPQFPRRCPVERVEKLTRAEIEALPPNQRF